MMREDDRGGGAMERFSPVGNFSPISVGSAMPQDPLTSLVGFFPTHDPTCRGGRSGNGGDFHLAAKAEQVRGKVPRSVARVN